MDDAPPKLQIRINSTNFSINFKPKAPTLLTAASLGDLNWINVILFSCKLDFF